MDSARYGNLVVTEIKKSIELPAFRHRDGSVRQPSGGSPRKERVLWLDNDVVPGAFYSEYAWHFPGQSLGSGKAACVGPEPHTHFFDEVIGFVGTNPDDLFDLGGEVELWLEDERFIITRSFLVCIPAGMRHCPVSIRRINRPIFQYNLGSAPYYGGEAAKGEPRRTRENLTGQFVFQYKKNLVQPEYRAGSYDEPGRHVHITYLDAEVVPEANFYVEASWFGTAERPPHEPGKGPVGPQPHVHPFPELITFFGTNPDDVHDLGGELEIWIDGEKHIINRSCVVYIPGDVIHCPLMLRNIKRPIFHFTAGPGKMYI